MTVQGEALLGHIIDGYRLTRILGKGGTSVVFYGEKPGQPQGTAIKVLLPPARLSKQDILLNRRRFVREALVLSEKLHHPHILPVLNLGEDEDTELIFMVMPYIGGGTLATRILDRPLTFTEIAHYINQISDALDYAHQQQVIHRDLKPANVLLDERDHVYLADFGIAKIFDLSNTPITAEGSLLGTPEYMAPEQAQGGTVSVATDIYGFGMLVYTMIAGQLPYPPAPVGLMLAQVIAATPIPPRVHRPELPEAAEEVLLLALDKDPSRRFPSAKAFAGAFLDGLQGRRWKGPPVLPARPERDDSQKLLLRQQGYAQAITASSVSSSRRRAFSRRSFLIGGAGLSLLGIGGVLAFSSASKNLSALIGGVPLRQSSTSLSMKPEVHTASPTPISQTQSPPSTPVVTPTEGAAQGAPSVSPTPLARKRTNTVRPLTITITDIPFVVVNKDTVSVKVMANAQSSVVLHVTYSTHTTAFTSDTQFTDDQGQATLSWPVRTKVSRGVGAQATVVAEGRDQLGRKSLSDPVQVTVLKD